MTDSKQILIINCGSSTVKYQLISFPDEKIVVKGLIDKIGSNESSISIAYAEKNKIVYKEEIENHKKGLQKLFNYLSRASGEDAIDLNTIDAVGHRVVHGGEDFTGSVMINSEVVDVLKKNIQLAPLHNPPNIEGIDAISKLLPDIPQTGVFDTAFHQTIPDHAFLYALPYKYYKDQKIRRYGFHGTSHQYVFQQACSFLKKDGTELKAISCHLGNGASVAAINYGLSMDTSMGLTPNEGLIMGTRTGDLDNGALLYIARIDQMDLPALNKLINKDSGLIGISGLSNDMRVLENAAESGNDAANLAIKMFNYRVKKFIGSYLAVLNGADVIIFTGGIGENSSRCRSEICDNMEYAGIKMDKEKNQNTSDGIQEINHSDSKVKILLIPTNEEIMIAKETLKLISSY